MSKKYYKYDMATGIFIEEGEVAIDILEEEHYPTDATLVPIPTPEVGKVAVYNTTTQLWKNVEDVRGKTYYNIDGESKVLDSLDIPEGYYPTKPAPTLDKVKADKMIEILNTFSQKQKENVSFTTKASLTNTYQANSSSMDSIMVVLNTGSVPDNFYWLDIDNKKVSFTFEDLQNLYNTIYERNWLLFQRLQQLKEQLRDEKNILKVADIVW